MEVLDKVEDDVRDITRDKTMEFRNTVFEVEAA